MGRMWKGEQMAQQWSSAIVCSMHKKSNNYSENFLLNLTYKYFTYLDAQYLERYGEETLFVEVEIQLIRFAG
jgi:hypothetical protein